MVSERKQDKVILNKYSKRLGIHQMLIERMRPAIAANYSRGKNWRELMLKRVTKGFYTDYNQTQLSA
jgi:hypothetical protein